MARKADEGVSRLGRICGAAFRTTLAVAGHAVWLFDYLARPSPGHGARRSP